MWIVSVIAVCAHAQEPSAPLRPRFTIEQRVTVRERVREDAEVCLVHFHGNEVPAREVMELHAKSACANVLWLEDTRRKVPWGDDRIPVPSSAAEGGACSVNPNRVLTPAAFSHRIDFDCETDLVARAALRTFLDDTLLPALERCRGGNKKLPAVTYHNNSRLTVAEMDAREAVSVKGQESNILLVTRAQDYAQLKALGRFSVALQSAPPADDGSLSVLWQADRYINVEAHIEPDNRAANEAMSEAALRVLGGWRCGPADEAQGVAPTAPAAPRSR
jgi:hypothetical protein